jgi:hypothetical protein
MPLPTQAPVKRKHDAITPSLPQVPSSQGDMVDIDDEEKADNQDDSEDVNELYCGLRVGVVGLQYYDGNFPLNSLLSNWFTFACRHGRPRRRG